MSVTDNLAEAIHAPGYNKTVPEVLRGAASRVEESWIQNDYGTKEGGVCTLGALHVVITGNPIMGVWLDDVAKSVGIDVEKGDNIADYWTFVDGHPVVRGARNTTRDAISLLSQHLRQMDEIDYWDDIASWNDREGQTKEHVAATLRKVADRIEAEEAAA